ncbi:D-alanyl-D-alanine carboxypeptidase/D-alanyl-D-alanine-endopeptidase [Streptomyces agglomeratus]|uniref:D-alanyl-D-alanine carboxypeptidase/D-alanyl-D-alanine-endopeptidase n=1 Tax=Streptomyces agglomeratus TaxID=285458 RepID=A0A1E5P8G1_9ACTN|nr:D-alanyl-D-alanine carboxypeptidase/D-alanyl-D-alanine-endopeptidase [Streptomyces agglomeratus]OEJ25747.1 D-alanyl-D-alanine carboxypeptidase/D-alanyl-D-alanine-endopeptidase [Streptomyces agglomeratus]OEJ52761.1 D-alanyl-D-alanine carboxypeptidase/D-alanyl-D-alanine-endopeptidase [Streptomyces agglomeratus]OEJ60099.1 D-alanyl-D-alanine carboxypeptidase/D-alanyl-D-alanine-endopeptidase [Streptomyces agglomeratus]
MPERKTWQLAAIAAVAGLALSAGAVAAAGPWDSGQRKAERAWAASQDGTGGAHHQPGAPDAPPPAPRAPGVLTALGRPVPPPAASGLADALDPLLRDPALGTRRTASVIDTATGAQVYGKGDADGMVPASTIKIATAVAALSALGPGHRIATTVTADRDGEKTVLVGGGDPTLDRDALGALADDTARVLRDRGAAETELAYDTTLYSGPDLHPIGPNENISPVSPLMIEEGRLDGSRSGPAPRSADPAADAARAFALMLRERGVRTKGDPAPGKGPAGAEPVARVFSAPLSALVERTLTHSDNDIAEALARQTALASDEPASFEGAGRAVESSLRKLRLPLDGARFSDGSGLDRDDRMSAALLSGLLARAADPARPALRPVLTGLPVAGFSGTLSSRYAEDAPGTGMVRAKTGTLSGVNTLAGTVVDADGRLLSFAFLASGSTGPEAAQSALDRLASTIANCGCEPSAGRPGRT